MEVFYCADCGKWINLEDAKHILVEEATLYEPEQYSDELYCECGCKVEEDKIVDDVVSFLNKKIVLI